MHTSRNAAVVMHRIDQYRNRLGRGRRGNPLPQVEHMAKTTRRRTERLQAAAHLTTNARFVCQQHRRVEVALQGHAVTDQLAGQRQVARPVQPQCIGATVGQWAEPLRPATGVHDRRHSQAMLGLVQPRQYFTQVEQRETPIGRISQDTPTGVHQHHGLGTGLDLRVQVGCNCLAEHLEQVMQQLGTAVEHFLDQLAVARRAAFHHVARQRPGAAGQPQHRHVAINLAAHLRNRLVNRLQGAGRGDSQTLDGALVISVFDGYLHATGLRLREPFGVASYLSADIEARHIDLAQLTEAFSFGSITGFVDADVRGLELAHWRPVGFDARIVSSPGDYRRRISQRAVQNIGALGGAGAIAAIQRSLLQVFDTFGYSELGLHCRLERGVCLMDGIDGETRANGGFVIVRGGGVPALDVIGYNRRVDWDELVNRLQRVIAENVSPELR